MAVHPLTLLSLPLSLPLPSVRLALAALFLAALILLVYWELVIAEGVHLGSCVVRLLYDWTAPRYNSIKCFGAEDEALFLGAPLAQTLAHLPAPFVLDVACGTGRLPSTLLSQPQFSGHIIGLDASRKMLNVAARAPDSRVTLVWQSAERLPFQPGTFDAVTCLEALEFVPNASRALAEIARVLRPGGILLTSNRIGPWAKLMPRHTMSTMALGQRLGQLGFERIHKQTWQVEYDLVWAIRGGSDSHSKACTLADSLACPHCHARLSRITAAWQCAACQRAYPIASDGVIEMLGR